MFSQFRFSSQGVVSNIFGKGPNLYVDPTESASVQWAVANLTCQQAQQNTSTYACVSTNSSCTRVISTMQGYVGYRCTCLPGYDGNPYIPDGCKGNYLFDQLRIQPDGIHIYILYPLIVFCGILSCTKMKSLMLMFPIFLLNKHYRVVIWSVIVTLYTLTCWDMVADIDECLQTPRICKELCHNTEGNYSCTMCPDHTEYDVIRMQCTPRRNQSLLLGESHNNQFHTDKRVY